MKCTIEQQRKFEELQKKSKEERERNREEHERRWAEGKRKISEARKGKKHSEETKAKIAAAMTGRTHSDETKAMISETVRSKYVEHYKRKDKERANRKPKPIPKAQGYFTSKDLKAIKDKIAEQSKHSNQGECYEENQVESFRCSNQANDGNGVCCG
jgi:hypothetical protein